MRSSRRRNRCGRLRIAAVSSATFLVFIPRTVFALQGRHDWFVSKSELVRKPASRRSGRKQRSLTPHLPQQDFGPASISCREHPNLRPDLNGQLGRELLTIFCGVRRAFTASFSSSESRFPSAPFLAFCRQSNGPRHRTGRLSTEPPGGDRRD